ncbi:MAG: hypothetical protein AB7F88_18350 [Pyrinomonadaceae bacterium]
MRRIVKNPITYWLVHTALIGPLIVLWAGVAYWFGFSSGVILRFVFPPMAVPLFLLVFPVAGLIWAICHFVRTPSERQLARGADVVVCVFLLFSILIVAGQFAGQ